MYILIYYLILHILPVATLQLTMGAYLLLWPQALCMLSVYPWAGCLVFECDCQHVALPHTLILPPIPACLHYSGQHELQPRHIHHGVAVPRHGRLPIVMAPPIVPARTAVVARACHPWSQTPFGIQMPWVSQVAVTGRVSVAVAGIEIQNACKQSCPKCLAAGRKHDKCIERAAPFKCCLSGLERPRSPMALLVHIHKPCTPMDSQPTSHQ